MRAGGRRARLLRNAIFLSCLRRLLWLVPARRTREAFTAAVPAGTSSGPSSPGAVRGVPDGWSLQRQRRRRRPGGEDAPEQSGELGRVDSLAGGGEFRQGPPAPLLDVVGVGGRLRVHVLGPDPGQVVLLGLADVTARDGVVLGAGGQVRAEVDVADAEFLAQFADDGLVVSFAGFERSARGGPEAFSALVK